MGEVDEVSCYVRFFACITILCTENNDVETI